MKSGLFIKTHFHCDLVIHFRPVCFSGINHKLPLVTEIYQMQFKKLLICFLFCCFFTGALIGLILKFTKFGNWRVSDT